MSCGQSAEDQQEPMEVRVCFNSLYGAIVLCAIGVFIGGDIVSNCAARDVSGKVKVAKAEILAQLKAAMPKSETVVFARSGFQITVKWTPAKEVFVDGFGDKDPGTVVTTYIKTVQVRWAKMSPYEPAGQVELWGGGGEKAVLNFGQWEAPERRKDLAVRAVRFVGRDKPVLVNVVECVGTCGDSMENAPHEALRTATHQFSF